MTDGGRPSVASVAIFAAVYLAVGALSLSTAFLQPNAAAVWIPSGFATGVLVARGRSLWPGVALGSFLLNLLVNLHAAGVHPAAAVAAAAAVAGGNTAEAVLAAGFTRAHCGGGAFLTRTAFVVRFLLLTVLLPPAVSTLVGVTVSQLAGLGSPGSPLEVAATWYIANAAGILIFTGLTVLALSGQCPPVPKSRRLEVVLFLLCLGFAIQAMCGLYVSEAIADWPKAYMLAPLLLWASLRFGAAGGLVAIALITFGASVGTLRGFVVFPAETEGRALTYLQLFLAMLSIMTLSLTAALAEADATRRELERRVQARTRDVEQLLRRRQVFTALVAHDLKSPVYGLRNALRATVSGLSARRIPPGELLPALKVMETTCTALGERIEGLLAAPFDTDPVAVPVRGALSAIVEAIAAAHRPVLRARGIALATTVPADLEVEHPPEVEHILDTLIDNAIRHSPAGAIVSVTAAETDGEISLSVSDRGSGIAPARAARLFQPDLDRRPGADSAGRPSLGLYLAAEQARWLGGRLGYAAGRPHGAVFTLVLPPPAGRDSGDVAFPPETVGKAADPV